MKRKIFAVVMVLLLLVTIAGCSDADVASQNLSTAADNFEITRRIVFYNGITDTYLLEITGKCSLGNYDTADSLSVTCKTGDGKFTKHYLGLSDNVTYFAEQLEGVPVDDFSYRIIFKPETFAPNIEVKVK